MMIFESSHMRLSFFDLLWCKWSCEKKSTWSFLKMRYKVTTLSYFFVNLVFPVTFKLNPNMIVVLIF